MIEELDDDSVPEADCWSTSIALDHREGKAEVAEINYVETEIAVARLVRIGVLSYAQSTHMRMPSHTDMEICVSRLPLGDGNLLKNKVLKVATSTHTARM